MAKKLRVVHYVNQFFGGLGGEEKANVGPQVIDGASGPGRALQSALGEAGDVVATAICGDNYIGEKADEAAAEIVELIRKYKPDVVIAGPAFEAGRYGVACGAVAKAVQEKLNIPAVSGMFDENPGVEIYHQNVWIIRTADSVRGMNDAVTKMAKLAIKLAAGEKIGKPAEEGYFPHGTIVNELADRTGAERSVDMLLRKLQGKPFETEVLQPTHVKVAPAPRIKDIKHARIAIVTDGGLVPHGNPDKIESGSATKFGAYSIEGKESLNSADYDVNHGGYDTSLVKQNPNRLVPVDALRELENEKAIGSLYGRYFTTAGVSTRQEMARKFAQSIAEQLKKDKVDGVILTST